MPPLLFGERSDISECEIRALEQQRLIKRLRQRVGKTIPEIESSGMTLTVVTKGIAGDVRLIGVHRGLWCPDSVANDKRPC